jgi:hypothetical protein
MAAVVVWRCDCRVEYKAVFESSSKSATIRCATENCKTRHIITGEVTQLFLQTAPGKQWRPLHLSEFIVDSRTASQP